MQYKLYIVISTNYETYTYTVVYSINVVIVFYMQAMMINLWASEWVKDVNAKRTSLVTFKNTLKTKQTSLKLNQQPILQNQYILMQNKRSPMQNQQTCTELTLDNLVLKKKCLFYTLVM